MCWFFNHRIVRDLAWLRGLKWVLDLNDSQHKLRQLSLQIYCQPALHIIINKILSIGC